VHICVLFDDYVGKNVNKKWLQAKKHTETKDARIVCFQKI